MDKKANLELDKEEVFNRELHAILAKDDLEDTDIPTEEDVSDDSEEELDEDSELGEGEDTDDTDDAELPADNTEELEEEDIPPIVKKVSSKEEKKIVELKRENREIKERLAKAEANKAAEVESQKLEVLVNKYTSQGYDEDTAKHYASQEFDMQEQKLQIAVLTFEARNADLFKEYPEARQNIETIMAKAKSSGFTAKEVCSILYKEESSPSRERAKQAVSGTLERTKSNNNVSSATRSAETPATTSLTPAQKTGKSNLMKAFPSLRGMSDRDYLNTIK